MTAPGIQLDWRSYFLGFCEKHGGDPPWINFKGRLLFPDGWTYAAKDYRGPEWSPPSDPEELRILKLAYWTRRTRLVKEQHDDLERSMLFIKSTQLSRSAPLKQVSVFWDNEQHKYVTARSTIDVGIMQRQMIDLKQKLLKCEEQLALVKGKELVGEV